MIFTDEDLKRLKECIPQETGRLEVGLFRRLPLKITEEMPDPTLVSSVKVDLVALLARLEAAENTIYAMFELDDCIALGSTADDHNTCVNKALRATDEWRKAAGK